MDSEDLPEGLYDLLLDRQTASQVSGLTDDAYRIQSESEDELDPEALPQKFALQVLPHLIDAFESRASDGPESQAELANKIIDLLSEEADGAGVEQRDLFELPPKRLLGVLKRQGRLGDEENIERPGIPLTSSDLLVNGRRELHLGNELRRELQSADRVDLICAFLKYSGLAVILDELEAFLSRNPGGLRVITTTYMGATDRKAVDKLVDLGADVRISYNQKRTRLHAKAWLFQRDTGFSTAFVGSSNLSHSALHDGLEWNVRLSNSDNQAILQRFESTFEQYWEDPEFEAYDAAEHSDKLDEALKNEGTDDKKEVLPKFEIRPYPHQREILDDLQAEREAGHNRNIVVSATGTGKTVVAALDYRRLQKDRDELSLLFVAHRKEILEQSRSTFRHVLRDPSFGECLYGGNIPTDGTHVFASIQSLHADRLEELESDAYDMVIVDEFHHAKAPTYDRFLDMVEPEYLLGLTATPERADGKNVLEYFDNRIASEIRLWDALDRELLCPFRYFGIADDVDLSQVSFSGGRYNREELTNLYTGDDLRVQRIVNGVQRYVAQPQQMRALGFCVTLDHAEYMADAFCEAGLEAVAVAGNPPRRDGQIRPPFADRDEAVRKLRDGEITTIFTVDLFNEGVDIKTVDTELLLRPTESSRIFLQQLGRGLRHAEGKNQLTVLDFIGNAHNDYRYDVKYRALVGGTQSQVKRQVEEGFPQLPPGCDIKLDRQSQNYVLENIRRSLNRGVRGLADELRQLTNYRSVDDVSFQQYIEAVAHELGDIYSRSGRSWTDLKRRANLPWPDKRDGEERFLRGVARMQHIDDEDRLERWTKWLKSENPPEIVPIDRAEGKLQAMFLGAGVDHQLTLDKRERLFAEAWSHKAYRYELLELFEYLDDTRRNLPKKLGVDADVTIKSHARYSLAEIMAGFGVVKSGNLYAPREGVFWDDKSATDLLFITLQKTEDEYSPETLYRDYVMTERKFHWESQHTTSADSRTGQRYINHQEEGSNVVLFVRKQKKVKDLTQPYLCLGKANYVRHESSRPMKIVWELEHKIPSRFYQDVKMAAG